MIWRTQKDLVTGDCWQTCVACLLDVDPDDLPSQVDVEREKKLYHTALNTYLIRHHALIYMEVHEPAIHGLQIRHPGWHTICGPTVRTETNGRHHVVIGRYGVPVWDPHPSRAGLLRQERWGLLVPPTKKTYDFWVEKGYLDDCACPACLGCPAETSRLRSGDGGG